ncbi:DUF4339 domain-containing protein, partial [Hydrogenobaculum sp.]
MWFYAKDDRQIGPVSEDIIVELIRNGEITRETKVWRDGFQDWKKLEDTELVKYLVEAPKAPSYISNKSIDNTNVTNKSSENLKTLLIVMASVLITVVALSIGYVFIIKNKSSKSNEVNNYNQPPVATNQPQPSQAPPQPQYQQPPSQSTYASPQTPQASTQYPPSQYSQTNEIAAIDLVVENYYSNIPNNLEVSYEQLSPERRATMRYDSWAYGYVSTLYDKLQSIKVLELTPDYAKVFVTFQSKDIAN